jgi:hypothetical protein
MNLSEAGVKNTMKAGLASSGAKIRDILVMQVLPSRIDWPT